MVKIWRYLVHNIRFSVSIWIFAATFLMESRKIGCCCWFSRENWHFCAVAECVSVKYVFAFAHRFSCLISFCEMFNLNRFFVFAEDGNCSLLYFVYCIILYLFSFSIFLYSIFSYFIFGSEKYVCGIFFLSIRTRHVEWLRSYTK